MKLRLHVEADTWYVRWKPRRAERRQPGEPPYLQTPRFNRPGAAIQAAVAMQTLRNLWQAHGEPRQDRDLSHGHGSGHLVGKA